MTFDLITENEHLWAVRYDDCLDNVLDSILGQWNDVIWLRSFFKHNIDDLASYFKITDVNQAIYDTIEDSERLQCLIMDISPDADLDKISAHWRIVVLRKCCWAKRRHACVIRHVMLLGSASMLSNSNRVFTLSLAVQSS